MYLIYSWGQPNTVNFESKFSRHAHLFCSGVERSYSVTNGSSVDINEQILPKPKIENFTPKIWLPP